MTTTTPILEKVSTSPMVVETRMKTKKKKKTKKTCGGGGSNDSDESTAPSTAHTLANTSISSDGISVLMATMLAFGRVHLAIIEAMKEIHKVVFPIYTKNSSTMTVNEYGELNQERMIGGDECENLGNSSPVRQLFERWSDA